MATVAFAHAASTVLVSIPNKELRRQFTEFLSGIGYACTTASNSSELLEMLQRWPGDEGVLIAEVPLWEAPLLARRAFATRPGIKPLFVCEDPADVGRAVLPDDRVTFLEKPFGWSELRCALEDLLAPQAAHAHVMCA